MYNVKDFMMDKSVIPKFMAAGLYKINILIYDKDSVLVSGIEARVKLF